MGYINNQWLMAAARRSRDCKHGLIAAAVTATRPTQSWDKEHGAVVVLNVIRENQDHQDLVLTKTEAEQLIPLLIEVTGQEAWEPAVIAALKELPPKQLLAFLARLHSN